MANLYETSSVLAGAKYRKSLKKNIKCLLLKVVVPGVPRVQFRSQF